ncbi:hypothetical protein RN001_010450 [Aquatica leii]|uniref:Ell-associated factor Eaf n=1 Tax=Aquatica leii TaxID=1421715 RepID=A0AAN7P6H3_9COLE|nr:hypothetical protein RN001_010450 [Aquatica leii]
MADKLGLGNEVRQLKLGQSFTNPKSTAFHTIRYDFKPASVDVNKIANVEVGSNHQVTVTVPHLDGAGVPQTVFKGPQRPYQKECVLIIDRLTGAVTLEKLSSNIQVKKTRSESVKPPLPQGEKERGDKVNTFGTNRPQTPPIAQRTSNKTRVTSGSRRPDRPITHLVPKHSPLHASPNYPSPGHYKSPKRDLHVNTESHNPSMSASLPIIGEDDFSAPVTNIPPMTQKSPSFHTGDYENGEVSEMSSSSSSDSDSDSDHDRAKVTKTNGYSNGVQTKSMPADHFLNEDLNLSDSGSD